MSKFKRRHYQLILERLNEPRRFIQILFGPRQVGKTTLMQQVQEVVDQPFIFAAADAESDASGAWISRQWERARLVAAEPGCPGVLLVLDEVQKIDDWSAFVKKEWDDDSRNQRNIKVVLLGSSSLMIKKGMTESLSGRFELVRIPHWSYREMHEAFGLGLDEYIYFGGYPGAADLIPHETRWKQYVRDALIEPAITRDILMMTRIDKPALLRQLFHLAAVNSGKIISYTKLLGQLHDAGNTTTLAHYCNLLHTAGLLGGLHKYAGTAIRRRSSIPKFQVHNNALLTALDSLSFKAIRQNPEIRGHYVESAVGAHLVNMAFENDWELCYWREGNYEVDFVLSRDEHAVAFEVKSGKNSMLMSGLAAFHEKFRPRKSFVIGQKEMTLEEFFNTPAQRFWD